MKLKTVFIGCLSAILIVVVGAMGENSWPSQEETDSFYAKLEQVENESGRLSGLTSGEGSATEKVKDARAFLRNYLTTPGRFPGATTLARAALALFRIDPNSELAQNKLIELMRFIRESDDGGPDYLGIFTGLEEMGPRAQTICKSFDLEQIPEWHDNRKPAEKLARGLCSPSNKSLKPTNRSDRNIIQPRRGQKSAAVSGSSLVAPYVIEGIQGQTISVDLGEIAPTSRPELTSMTFVNGAQICFGKLKKFESRCEQPCKSEPPVCHFVGQYLMQGAISQTGTIAIPRRLAITKATASLETVKQGFEISQEDERMDLLYGGEIVLSAYADYNDPKLVIQSKFDFEGKTYYVLTAGLKLEDTTGLLFQDGEQWKFLYRTVEPSHRITICDN